MCRSTWKAQGLSAPCSLAGICLLTGLGLDNEDKSSILAYLQFYHSSIDGVIPRVQRAEAENIHRQLVPVILTIVPEPASTSGGLQGRKQVSLVQLF